MKQDLEHYLENWMPEAVHKLAGIGSLHRYPKRSIIISEGDEGTCLFLLLEGSVRVFAKDETDKKFVFCTFEEGTLFGETAMDGGPRTASVEAISDCVCVSIPFHAIKKRLAQDPEFGLALVMALVSRSRAATEAAKSLALDSVYRRILKLLEREVVSQGEVKVVPQRLSQQDIASQVGASRDMVAKIFKELTKGGYISNDRKLISILKPLPREW